MFSCVPEFAFTQNWLLRFAFFIGLNSLRVSVHLLNYIRVYFPLILFCYIIFASAKQTGKRASGWTFEGASMLWTSCHFSLTSGHGNSPLEIKVIV